MVEICSDGKKNVIFPLPREVAQTPTKRSKFMRSDKFGEKLLAAPEDLVRGNPGLEPPESQGAGRRPVTQMAMRRRNPRWVKLTL